ncbi:FAD:protein FMN transferase [Pontiella agarivorans]|uniref:FAD:protein FMN transferase n=1 Tax=Pontiella agarivorans TaxID=3038953 RepID=A0ABU5MTW0_9BACT|nr:FAD:protein FMN transferase [Pontiella agarivorans]MDZ8117587.1 FAD:protein FMN transferase [Pontiella agarivorans]
MTPKQVRKSLIALVVILVLTVGGMLRSVTLENPATGGETMGTGYSVKITGKVKQKALEQIYEQIQARLTEINRQMSTWDPDSEISRFNHSRSLDGFQCSEEFAQVVRRALELSEKSGGAFDPTLQPLLNLWGFGSEGHDRNVPDEEAIRIVKETTGADKLSIDASSRLLKTEPEISLALGAIAKGYGVDEVGKILAQAGLENWFIEIGGEVLASGVNPDGVPWRIGIQYPTTNPMSSKLQGIVSVKGGAIATSGNYRNYMEEDGVIYSHILDPRTGRAVKSHTASVTVSAPNCMDADALATALFVMGPEEGISWVESLDEVETMFLIRDETGKIAERFSSGFEQATGYSSAL